LADRELACVPNSSEEGESYRKAMFAALNFAWSNRQMITHWTRKAFERVFKQSEADLDMKLVYDVAHNIAKVEKYKIDGKLKSVVVHRKGATRAFPAGRDESHKNTETWVNLSLFLVLWVLAAGFFWGNLTQWI